MNFKRFARGVGFLLALYIPTVFIFYLAFTKEYSGQGHLETLRFVILLLFFPIIFKYVIQFFLAPIYSLTNRREAKRATEYNPSVSVLIPAWNEEVGIVDTIKSVATSRYNDFEIIVINDGSTDATDKVVNEYLQNREEQLPVIKYERISNGGKAKALNHGLTLAQGEIIVTIDADCVVDNMAIANLVKKFINKKVASVAGNVIIGNRSHSLGLLQQLEYVYGFYFKRADSLLGAVYIVGGAAASYRAEVIRNLGGFDEKIITEDIELSTRIQDHGYQVKYAADAIIYTEGPSDFSGLCRQRLRWKYGRLLTFYKYRYLFFSRKKGHNKYLTFLILPIALFAEILLFFEWLLLGVFFTYTFVTSDYIPLVFLIAFLFLVISLQVLLDPRARYHLNLIWLAPVAWIMFYIMDVIEYQALIRSFHRLVSRKELVWQKWKRVGVFKA